VNDDAELVADVRDGHVEAFGLLVGKYQRPLFGLVLMMVRQPAGAEEVTQDAFVRAHTHLHRYDASRPFYPWLATIAVRLAHNWLHQHARIVRREGASIDEVDTGQAPRALHDLIADERNRQMWSAVAALPSGERTAAFLYYRDELSVADIAGALGVTTGTVKTLLFRARRHLREHLGAEFMTDGRPVP
jgi:RNA polymerase sigma-70 factor (ECF subfamily)